MAKKIDDDVLTARDLWTPWPVYWSAVWVGTLTALAAALVFGLAGLALGAQVLGPWPERVYDWSEVGWGALALTVFSAFLAYVAGGWVAGEVAGIRRAEPGMLHGAVVWLVTVPLLLLLGGLGAGGFLGGWYGGLAGRPAWSAPETTKADLTPEQQRRFEEERKTATSREDDGPLTVEEFVAEERARAVRNSALGTLTALLLGLVGAVIGGWMASGEPMNFGHYRNPYVPASRMVKS